jgi:WXG100 protein secretion system (Wss), protein YukD
VLLVRSPSGFLEYGLIATVRREKHDDAKPMRDRSYELPSRVAHDHDHSPSPDGRIALRVPTDVPLGELMPDFLGVIWRPGTGCWALTPAGGELYPNRSIFAELGVDNGTLLTAHEAAGAAPSASDRARALPAQPAAALVVPQRVCEGPLSDRTARTLPVRLSRPARCAMALRASRTLHHG